MLPLIRRLTKVDDVAVAPRLPDGALLVPVRHALHMAVTPAADELDPDVVAAKIAKLEGKLARVEATFRPSASVGPDVQEKQRRARSELQQQIAALMQSINRSG